MPDKKFITAEKLVKYLDQEAGNLLLTHDVYDIGNYGWQSEDTVDPKYIGHAMWQTNPPTEMEWDYLFDNVPVKHRPTEKEKLLTVAGSDFEGLMRASRLSIGLCLLHKTIAAKTPLEDNHYFWLHHTDSILQLNMASDRIREYFLVAFFNETSDTYKRKGKNNGWFTTPFIEARAYCQNNQVNQNITDAVTGLPDLAEIIFPFRETRNEVVHEISTILGRMHKDLVESQQQAFDSKCPVRPALDKSGYVEMRQRQEEMKNRHEQELSKSSLMIVEWYKILVQFSGHIFEAEHWMRKA